MYQNQLNVISLLHSAFFESNIARYGSSTVLVPRRMVPVLELDSERFTKLNSRRKVEIYQLVKNVSMTRNQPR